MANFNLEERASQGREHLWQLLLLFVVLQWKGLVVYCPLCQNLQLSKSIDAGDGRLMDLVDSSSTTRESMESKEVLRNDDCTNSGVLLSNGDRSSELAKTFTFGGL